jgi:hypothetical protein
LTPKSRGSFLLPDGAAIFSTKAISKNRTDAVPMSKQIAVAIGAVFITMLIWFFAARLGDRSISQSAQPQLKAFTCLAKGCGSDRTKN